MSNVFVPDKIKYRSVTTFGRTQQKVEQMILNIFTSRTWERNAKGIRIPGAAFRLIEFEDYLSEQPKLERHPCRRINLK